MIMIDVGEKYAIATAVSERIATCYQPGVALP
jgi:hypothetical protein